MLEVRNLNKYYNKKKSNEIHVINDTTFKLGEKGLIAILGHSGSGKSTLLNSLCGIDTVDSGELVIDGQVIKKYNANKMDDIRNKYFGYIFQNYNLNNNQTVYENVSFSLELLGMKDPKEIEERTMHALKIVQMDKYRNRLAKNLSGGQMQRVSIARAIVKDAKIILADEATGNLDRKNTVIIMSILREIANERLVVMVTHERELAFAYSDRILEIQDGVVVKDIENDAMSQEYSYDDDNIIHLGDYNKDELVKEETVEVNRYYRKNVGNVKIDFIIKDNQVFIQTTSPMDVRIIDENSLVKFDYQKKENFETPLIDKDEVKIDPIDEKSIRGKYRINVFKTMFDSLLRLFGGRSIKRFVLMAFLISSFLLTVSLSLLKGFGTIDEKKYMRSNRDLVEIKLNDVTRATYEAVIDELLAREDVYNIMFGTKDIKITTPYYEIDKTNFEETIDISGLVQSVKNYNIEQSLIDKLDNNSVLIDQYLVDYLISTQSLYFQTNKSLLNQKLIINGQKFTIVGITNQNNFNVYFKDDIFESILLSDETYKAFDLTEIGIDYKVYNNVPFSLEEGEIILAPRGGNNYEITLHGVTFKIDKAAVVIPETAGASCILLRSDLYKLKKNSAFDTFTTNLNALANAKFYVYTNDYEKLINDYEKTIVSTYSEYANAKKAYETIYLGITLTISVISGIIFIAPLIMLYFLMRSSTISKIKEIAICRSLGMRNSSVIATQFVELVSITAIYAIPGYLLAIVIMFMTNGIFAEYALDPLTLGTSLVIILLIIVLVGLLPILRIVKKVPQKLITKYDI